MLFSKSKKEDNEALQEKEVQDDKSINQKRGLVFGTIVNPISRLKQLANRSHNVLLTFKSIYPLDLFPDTVTIDANKVNIIKKDLFGAENVHSILIADITNVTLSTGLFTGTLEIVDSMNLRFPTSYTIHHLHIKNALKARQLIQGLISCHREGIDLSNADKDEILESLYSLGYAKGENNKN